MRCLYCDRPLVCAGCGKPLRVTRAVHEALHQSEAAVRCPECEEVLRCQTCEIAYSGDHDEYGESRE